jgi:hypothetical protein
MNTLVILEGLRENVKFWQYKFDTCKPHEARAMQQKVFGAKQILKEFKVKYMPHLLVPPTPPKREISVRMSDWTENFEEFANY